MVRFMLSFDEGTPIAIAVDKNDVIKHIIRAKEDDEDQDPDIIVDDLFSILKMEDIEKVGRAMKLSRIERNILSKALKRRSQKNISPKLKEAYLEIIKEMKNKLKTELNFEKNLRVLPALGFNNAPFDRHIFIVGASNSGKSFLAADIIKFDQRKRKGFLFSKLFNDPAFKDLIIPSSDDEDEDQVPKEPLLEDRNIIGQLNRRKEIKKLKKKQKKLKPSQRFHHIKISTEENLMDVPQREDLTIPEGRILLFDDIDTFRTNTGISEYLREYCDDILECGRKNNLSVIRTCHELRGHKKTKKSLNEAEWIILFPSTNQMLSNKFLKDSLGLLKFERENIVHKAARNRYMCIKQSAPLAVLHEHGVMLL